MRYARARYEQDRRDLAYRVYVSDSLSLNAQGKWYEKRYIDMINPAPVDNRSAIEIANDVLSRAGVEVIHSDEFV